VIARAVVVGINDYPGSTRQKTLAGAVDDAIDFARWAIHPQGGKVPEDQLYFWGFPQPAAMPEGMERYVTPNRPWPYDPAPDFSVPPEAKALVLALEAAAEAASGATGETGLQERLYVYLAGHGAMTQRRSSQKDAQNCLLTADFVPNKAFGLIPLDDLRRMLEMRGPRETLIFSDCCRGELPLSVPDPVLNASEYADMGLNEQWIVGRAAAPGAIAYETPIAAPKRGSFTKLLVQALRQFRTDGQLTLPELRGFVRAGVKADVAPRIQAPKFEVKDDDLEEPFVLATGAPIGDLPNLTIRFPEDLDGQVRILDSSKPPAETLAAIADGKVTLPLPPGQLIIEHVASGRDRLVFHFGPETTNVDF
jgi:hypothetical protein